MKQMPHYAAGIIFSLCLMITLLITSVEAVVYWLPGYFEKEYTKYGVAEVVDMTMEDLLDVTDEMMAYLRGKRADLHVQTTMGGVSREFFNEREIAHMEDVRGLFLDALLIRRVCLILMVLCLIPFLLTRDHKSGHIHFRPGNALKRVFPKAVCIGTALFFALTAGLAAIISTNFTKYFILFHHIFFTNDLWILDPGTDMLINIVPEGFFSDTVVHIAVVFFLCVAAVFGISIISILKYRENMD